MTKTPCCKAPLKLVLTKISICFSQPIYMPETTFAYHYNQIREICSKINAFKPNVLTTKKEMVGSKEKYLLRERVKSSIIVLLPLPPLGERESIY